MLSEELVGYLRRTEGVEHRSDACLEETIGRVERVELVADVRVGGINNPNIIPSAGSECHVPELEDEFLVALAVEVDERMPVANVLFDDVLKSCCLACAANPRQVCLHGALVHCPD